MSALRLKANMLSVSIDVRYVPIADMAAAKDPRSQGTIVLAPYRPLRAS